MIQNSEFYLDSNQGHFLKEAICTWEDEHNAIDMRAGEKEKNYSRARGIHRSRACAKAQ